MATYSTDELVRKALATYARDRPGEAGQVLSRPDLLAQWPKGFTHVELSSALEYACSKGWLAQAEDRFMPTQSGLDTASEFLQRQ